MNYEPIERYMFTNRCRGVSWATSALTELVKLLLQLLSQGS